MSDEPQLTYDTRVLYQLYHDKDNDHKGYLTRQQFSDLLFTSFNNHAVLQSKSIYVFWDLLVTLSDYEEDGIPSCYIHQFIRLLRQQQRQYESRKMYEQAQSIEQRCKTLQINEYERRLVMMRQAEAQRIEVFNKAIIDHLRQFQLEWKEHLADFEKQSQSVIWSIKMKQAGERRKSWTNLRLRSIGSNPQSSKQLLRLQNKQKELVQAKQYKKASKIRDHLSLYKKKVKEQTILNQQQFIEKKLHNLKKDQFHLIQNVQDRIQLQRFRQEANKKQTRKSIMLKARLLAKDFKCKIKQEQQQLLVCLKQEFGMDIDTPKKHILPLKKIKNKFQKII